MHSTVHLRAGFSAQSTILDVVAKSMLTTSVFDAYQVVGKISPLDLSADLLYIGRKSTNMSFSRCSCCCINLPMKDALSICVLGSEFEGSRWAKVSYSTRFPIGFPRATLRLEQCEPLFYWPLKHLANIQGPETSVVGAFS